MKPRLHLLLTVLIILFGTAPVDCLVGTTQRAWAQPPGGSSRSGESDRDRYRGRFGDRDRGRGDWRGSRSRDDEHRGEERRRDDRSGSGGSSSSGSSSSNSGNSSSSPRPTSSSSSSSSSTSTPSTPSSSSSASSNDRLKKWATELVTKNDKNGDMILDKDEQAGLAGSVAASDLDHDGKITIDEIVLHHSGGSSSSGSSTTTTSSTSTPSSSSSDSGRGGSGDSRSKTNDPLAKRVLTGTAGGMGKDADKRRTYRFSKAADKLPTGLPSFFSRDANHDGQVSLSEYSRSLNSSVLAEFRRYDLNDDGLITAKEATTKK